MNKDQPRMHFEPKGWGWERWIVNKPEYCGKLLYMAKDRRCSLHYHKLKDETFYLQSGEIIVYYTDDLEKLGELMKKTPPGRNWRDFVDTARLRPGDNFYIPPERAHQMVARRDSELFEFSTQHFENDSYRILRGD